MESSTAQAPPSAPVQATTVAEAFRMTVDRYGDLPAVRTEDDAILLTWSEDGWLHTGDIATIDDDGYVTLVDRKKELIISSAGRNMSPANIESELKGASPVIGQPIRIGDARPRKPTAAKHASAIVEMYA